MSPATTRRDALVRAGLATSALAIPALLRPQSARADDDRGDLEDFLEQAVDLEQAAVLAYAEAAKAKDLDAEQKRTFERFRDQEQAHADAMRQALDSLGVDPPDAPEGPQDTGAFDGLDDIDGAETLKKFLVDLLRKLDKLEAGTELNRLLLEVENQELRLYLDQTPEFESEDLLRVGAEIGACQAQHVVVLREAQGEEAVAAASAALAASEAGSGGESK